MVTSDKFIDATFQFNCSESEEMRCRLGTVLLNDFLLTHLAIVVHISGPYILNVTTILPQRPSEFQQ